MKLVALFAGIVASAFAWAAVHYLIDLEAAFLALWPASKSQQMIGLVVWHAIAALPLIGGLATVFSPVLGGLVLIGATAAWVYLGTRLPTGFDIQLLVPLLLSGVAAIAAFGAAIRGLARRRAAARPPTPDEMAREQALRLEPSVDLRRAFEDETGAATIAGSEAAPSPPDEPGAAPDREQAKIVLPDPPRRVSRSESAAPGGLAGLVALNVAALLLLTASVGALLYVEYRSGALFAAFAPGSVADSPVLETSLAQRPAVAVATKMDRAIGDDAGEAPTMRLTRTPLAEAAPVAETWSDPFAYCAAVGTVDSPDGRYTGPAVASVIAEALDVPASSSPDRVRWRCVEGALMACTSFEGPVCDAVPSLREMKEFCAGHAGADGLQAPGGVWRCDGTEPDLPTGETWPADPRGFLLAAWSLIPTPLRPDGLEG